MRITLKICKTFSCVFQAGITVIKLSKLLLLFNIHVTSTTSSNSVGQINASASDSLS